MGAARSIPNPSELQLNLTRVLINAPAGVNLQQKQLALIVALEELTEHLPHDNQAANTVAVLSALLLGVRMVTVVSAVGATLDPNALD